MEKQRVLKALKEGQDYISGEALSNLLGVSRTSIWKYINELKNKGYQIESSSKKGYRLLETPDVLSKEEILHSMKTKIIGKEIICFENIDSTNNYAKKIASEGCEDGTVVVSEIQTNGRGRLGRSWESPNGKGIWMSIVLKPDMPPEDVQLITLAASVAVVKAIEKETGIKTGIKWPNDIVLSGSKLCGILTEMSCEMERVAHVVVGIGLNVNHDIDDFHESIKKTATSLKIYRENQIENLLNRSRIMRSILEEFEEVYLKIKDKRFEDIIEEWRKYSVTLGKKIKAFYKGNEIVGIAKEITYDGKLLIEVNNEIFQINSGEVSIRGIMGYI